MDVRAKTVSNAIARGVLQVAESLDVSGEQFLRLAGLTRAEVFQPHGRVAGHKHQRLMRLTEHAPVNTSLLRGGLEPLFADYLNLASVCTNCATLREAVDTFLRYRGVIGELDVLVCRERDDALLFDYISDDPLESSGKSALANFAMLVKLVRHYSLDRAPRFDCALQAAPLRQAAAVEAFFEGPVASHQAANQLKVTRAALDTPFPHHNPLLHAVFLASLSAEHSAIVQPDSFAGRVTQFVRDALVSGGDEPEVSDDRLLDQLCEAMSLTRWTVRRRLQRDGCTYKDLVVHVKLAEARRLLREDTMPLGLISDLLGFASQGSFTRFFKANEGVAPLTYRRAAPG